MKKLIALLNAWREFWMSISSAQINNLSLQRDAPVPLPSTAMRQRNQCSRGAIVACTRRWFP